MESPNEATVFIFDSILNAYVIIQQNKREQEQKQADTQDFSLDLCT